MNFIDTLKTPLGQMLGQTLHFRYKEDMVGVSDGRFILHPDDFDALVELAWRFYAAIESEGLQDSMPWARWDGRDFWGMRSTDASPTTEWATKRICRTPPPPPASLIYFVQSGNGGPIKIGVTTCLEQRLAQLQKECHKPLHVLMTMRGDRSREKALHQRFVGCRLGGEWFDPHEELLWYIEGLQ